MNDLQRYSPPGSLVPSGDHQTDVLANHAAADALIGRLMATPVARPRVHREIVEKLRFLAETAGEEFFYAWDVKLKGGGKSEVSGPSIELAMGIVGAIGNCGYTTTHIVLPDAFVITAYFVDRESGNVHSRQFRQRREQRIFGGKRKDEDLARQEDIAFQIGQSKAIRNVIVRAGEIKPYVDLAMREARRNLVAKIEKEPDQTKARICARLGNLHIPVDRVGQWVGRGPERWDASDMVKISAALNAIGEGLAEAAELWPDPALAAGPPPPPPPPRRDEPPPPERDDGRPDPTADDPDQPT